MEFFDKINYKLIRIYLNPSSPKNSESEQSASEDSPRGLNVAPMPHSHQQMSQIQVLSSHTKNVERYSDMVHIKHNSDLNYVPCCEIQEKVKNISFKTVENYKFHPKCIV